LPASAVILARRQTELVQGDVAGIQRGAQAGVEGGVRLRGQAARLQTVKQVEAQFEIVQTVLVEVEKRARSPATDSGAMLRQEVQRADGNGGNALFCAASTST